MPVQLAGNVGHGGLFEVAFGITLGELVNENGDGVEEKDNASTSSAQTDSLALIADLAETMKYGSLCALGGFTPYPVLSAIKHWPEDFA